jgi:nickel-dependent lactate racemase
MKIELRYGLEEIMLSAPDDCLIYKSNFRCNIKPGHVLLEESLANSTGSKSFAETIRERRKGNAVIVVSDITRPVPYKEFLPRLITLLELNGVSKKEIMLLVATGMHRPSTKAEKISMFGEHVVNNYRIIDHECENERELQPLEGRSWSGSEVKLNRHYANAGYRIITGLVEPHFMAGFSGGRKSICPGLVSLDTLQKFHGFEFLDHSKASSGILKDNPCHLENSSIARMCPPDYTINVILDSHKKINAIISGELFDSHAEAVEYVKNACCPKVEKIADLAITSSGGYPLDATFYQCVKGMVNCLPAIKNNGEIMALGECSEGIGSPEYAFLLKKYSGRYMDFISEISHNGSFIKDQWQFQMQIKALKKTGIENLHFYTSGIQTDELSLLSVQSHYTQSQSLAAEIQTRLDQSVKEKKRIALFPEGPYCSPVL